MTKTFEELNKELTQKYIVYENGVCGSYAQLEAIYSWGYIVVEYSDVLAPQHHLYDNNNQHMINVFYDYCCSPTTVKTIIENGILTVKHDDKISYRYDLSLQAPIYTKDVKNAFVKNAGEIGYECILVVNNKVYYMVNGDGCSDISKIFNKDMVEQLGFVPVDAKNLTEEIDLANEYIISGYTSPATPFGDNK